MADATDAEVLKKKRTQSRSVLSRYSNSIKRHMAERDTYGVCDKLKQFKSTFESLEGYHYAYIEQMADGDIDISAENKWHSGVFEEYLSLVRKANEWLESKVPGLKLDTTSSGATSSAAVAPAAAGLSDEMAALLSLPRVGVPVFTGVPGEYQRFISRFDDNIDRRLKDDRAKLSRLLQCLEGAAYVAVEHCELSGPDGYQAARDILRERYGNADVATRNVVAELENGKPMTRASDLRLLADRALLACKTVRQLGSSSEIYGQQFFLRVVNRCHPQVKSRWISHALDHKEKTGAYPDFVNFCNFLDRQAKRFMDSEFGAELQATAVRGKATVFNTACSDDTGVCRMCKLGHEITVCPKFLDLQPHERLDMVKRQRLCFSCLEAGHSIARCENKSRCGAGCSKTHHRLLHGSFRGSGRKPDTKSRLPSGGEVGCTGSLTESSSCVSHQPQVYLPIVSVLVNGRYANALLDSGSTSTFITRRLADQLNLDREKSLCTVATIGNGKAAVSEMVSVEIRPLAGGQSHRIQRAYVVSNIPARLPGPAFDIAHYPYLSDLPLNHLFSSAPVDLLIGPEYPDLVRPLEIRCNDSAPDQPYATRTKLGWTLQGPLVGTVSCGLSVSHVQMHQLEQKVTNLWHIEREDEEVRHWSIEDTQVFNLWEDKVVFQDGHYELPIPWKDEVPVFPPNIYQAKTRLSSTLRRLKRTGMYDRYDAEMQKMITSGYAEKVPDDELIRTDGKLWYLPHHPVFHEAKPDKVRIVHDCAAACQGISLNSQCFRGPDLVNKLLHVLLRFRRYQHAVTADIQAMYMQVSIPVDDRDCLRFLWYVKDQVTEYRMASHLFGGVWCASSSTFALRQTLHDHDTGAPVRRAVLESMYVDDLLCSTKTVSEASTLVRELKTVLLKGGFNITKFMATDREVLQGLSVEDLTQKDKLYMTDAVCKALGIQWALHEDVFMYVAKPIKADAIVTRRFLLSCVSSLYDPLGLVIPVIITGRMLFQEATRLRLKWDDPVPEPLRCRWNDWTKSLAVLPDLRFPRCVIPEMVVDGVTELHHFCDSSSRAYGACTYIRSVGPTGQVRVILLQARGRLAPLHAITIPRLELCAAVQAVKLEIVARKVLGVDLLPSTFWTDSQIVLSYLRSRSARLRVFVANRVSYILENVKAEQWRFIAGKRNPADLITRGATPETLKRSQVWQQGPDFLSRHRGDWLTDDEPTSSPADDLEVLPAVHVVQEDPAVRHPFYQLMSHYSSFYRLCRAVAWLRRVRRRKEGQTAALSVAEIRAAEMELLRWVQREVYSDEVESLRRSGVTPRSSSIVSLDPVLQDGMLVVGGRLKRNVDMSCLSRHPVILPADHGISRMIMQEAHASAHLGVEWTLSLLRRKYWIPHARQVLKGIRRKCVICQKLFDRPLTQKMADLPPQRCDSDGVAFAHVGVDCFGPFVVKVGRARAKRYGCVFTCFTTRAVHLEVLSSLETDTFINAFRRFAARRGWPKSVRSDNGTNLVGAYAELRRMFKEINQGAVISFAATHMVDWTFNTPHASHHGGVWERMIRSIRRVLSVLLGKQVLTDEVLSTVLIEAEGIVNGRPLTKCSEDPDDGEVLTPNHFLRLGVRDTGDWSSYTDGRGHRRRWCQVQSWISQFWRRWKREYLLLLQERQKWHRPNKNIQVGDVVLVLEDSSPRGSWPIGLVREVYPGSDGLVRSVKLRVRESSFVRPVVKLIRLEC